LGDDELSFGVTRAAGAGDGVAELAAGVGFERTPKSRLKKLIGLPQQCALNSPRVFDYRIKSQSS